MKQVLIVANRLPVSWANGIDGERRLVHSPGGLVSALEPVAERMKCAWLGTLEGSSNMEFMSDGMQLMTVGIDPTLFENYYSGFANQVLWPLFHGLPERVGELGEGRSTRPIHAEWLAAYRSVNLAFAERAAEVAEEGALVWVNDYHLLLVPKMLRELRPDVSIAFFLHIPFPELEQLQARPWASELLRGLCAADLIGVQREIDAERLRAAQAALAAGFSDFGARIISAPISIDPAPYTDAAVAAIGAGAPAEFRRQHGLVGRRVLLSVDRLDYTKGVAGRLAAFEAILERWPAGSPLPVLLQVLTPTRQDIGAYRDYAEQVRVATERVNQRFSDGEFQPIVTLSEPHTAAELVMLFLVADVMCVTSLRDGMNLVAKEFAVSRVDERGVLVLSKDAGSADELVEAVVADPHDHENLVAALTRALSIEPEEQASRARALSARVRENDVYAWAENFLGFATSLGLIR